MTLQEIKAYYKSIFLLSDEHDTVIDAIVAIAINVHTESDSIWLMLLGAPSSGKTELAMTLSELKKCFVISTMTENTFLSSLNRTNGKENSLLREIGPKGLLIAKDYTTILSMNHDKRDAIISQFREVYDGHFVKRSGNGVGGTWQGKVNAILCCTDALFSVGGEGAEMGRRALNYVFPEMTDPERKHMMQMSNRNLTDIKEKRQKLKEMMKEFVDETIALIPRDDAGIARLPAVQPELEESVMDLANFLTKARTATVRNFQGQLTQVMWTEAPTRANNQLQMLAQSFQFLNGGTVSEEQKNCIFKIALDSIPKLRRITLNYLAAYDLVTTKGFAQHIGYRSTTVKDWLEDLNMLGIIKRSQGQAAHSPKADCWIIHEKYRDIILKYDPLVTRIDGQLEGNEDIDDSGGNYYSEAYNADIDPITQLEDQAAADKAWENIGNTLGL